MFRIDATRRGAVLFVFFLLLVGVADAETKTFTVDAEILGGNVLRLDVEGHRYYATCNSSCSFEDVKVDCEADTNTCGANVTSLMWDLRTLNLDSRDKVLTAIVNNRTDCNQNFSVDYNQIGALCHEQMGQLKSWFIEEALPKGMDFNKCTSDLSNANSKLEASEKSSEIMRTTFLNVSDQQEVIIAELRADKASVNSRYDGALIVILGLVAYTSGVLSFVIDKLRGSA